MASLQCARALAIGRSAILLALLALSRSGYGMDFSIAYVNPFLGSDHAYDTLLMHGEIIPGDYDRLLTFAIKNNVDLVSTQITLASPGGDVSEALRIGKLIKSLYAHVAVGPVTGRCASACFIIFASAVERSSAGGLVGIHRPYVHPDRLRSLSPSAAEALETRALLDAETYLHQLRVPSGLVDEMFEHASTEVHWLTVDELEHQLGKRPPWYEEFLIARCGLDKAAEQQFEFREPDNEALFNRLMAVFQCGRGLTRPEAVRSLNEALAPYRTQFASARQGRPDENGSSAADRHQVVHTALREAIPNWEQINRSDDFVAWLNHNDGFGSMNRRQTLLTAFNNNEAALVVAIFKAYLSDKSERNGVSATPATSGR